MRPVVSVTWYSESEWALVKASAVDPDRFEETYQDWLKMAEEALSQLVAAGIAPRKHPVAAKELLAWCLARGKANDAAARAAFVSEQASTSSPVPPGKE